MGTKIRLRFFFLVLYFTSSFPLKLQPSIEWARFVVNSKLRRYLKDKLLQEGCDSRRGWIRAFERWQLHNKFESRNTLSETLDPIIPFTVTLDGNICYFYY